MATCPLASPSCPSPFERAAGTPCESLRLPPASLQGALLALLARNTSSARHVERRVKTFSGRSLREWQSIVRTEGLFFAARERYEAGLSVDWAALAQDEGFTDQAHMIRSAKRITGFAPTEFAQRFAEDESFWVYRLWV